MSWNNTKRPRDFHRGRIANPFFVHPEPRRWGWLIVLIVFLLLLGGVGYVGAYSPLFRIKDVIVTGSHAIDPETIEHASREGLSGMEYYVLPHDLYFFVDPEAVKKSVEKLYPYRSVSVAVSRNKITVAVEERVATFRLIKGERYFLLDQDGAELREIAAREGENFIALESRDGESKVPASWTKFFIDLHEHFATHASVRDLRYLLSETDQNVRVVTEEGWQALFDPATNVSNQLESLQSALLAKFNPIERKRLEYIDVRFGDRIFYKWKGEEVTPGTQGAPKSS